MSVTIYHNPRCSKSRKTLDLIREQGIDPVIVEYLTDPPDAKTLADIVSALGIAPRSLLRQGEAIYRELGLDNPELDDATIVQHMVENPILIERPIVIRDGRAVIGRPPENVLDLLTG